MKDKLSGHFVKGVNLPQPSKMQFVIPRFIKNIGFARIVVVVVLIASGVTWLVFSKAATQFPTSRNKYTWPLSRYSFWNMPIGNNAVLSSSKRPIADNSSSVLGSALDVVAIFNEGDPGSTQSYTFYNTQWNQADKCQVNNSKSVTYQLPPNLSNNSLLNYNGNDLAAIIHKDGTFTASQYLSFCSGGNGWGGLGDVSQQVNQPLNGMGRYGGHGGTETGGFGGVIRSGELTNGIFHALDINIDGSRMYMDKSGNAQMWPAAGQDANASDYAGNFPDLTNGSLLTFPAGSQPSDYGVTSPMGTVIFNAIKNYGLYVTDNSYCNCAGLSPDNDSFNQLNSQASTLEPELRSMYQNLYTVTNNAPNNVGGGGTLRNCLAPPFDDGTPDGLSNPNNNLVEPTTCSGGGGGGTTNQPPIAALTASVTTGTAPLSVTITGTASDSDGTIAKIDLYQGSTLVKTVNAATNLSYSAANLAAGTYTFYINATDNSGAVTKSNTVTVVVKAAVSPGGLAPGTYDDTSAVYCGDSGAVACPNAAVWDVSPAGSNASEYNGSDHYTDQANMTTSITFTGTSIDLYGALAAANGQFTITIDNKTVGTYSQYSATRQDQAKVFSSAVLTTGVHNLVLTTTGTSVTNATGTFVSLDKIVVKGPAVGLESEMGKVSGGHATLFGSPSASHQGAVRFQ